MQIAYGKLVVKILVVSLALVGVGAVIWFVKGDSGWTYQNILFWVSITPIAVFTIGQFGSQVSRGNFDIQHSKSTINRSTVDMSTDEYRDQASQFKSGKVWIPASLLVLLASMLI